MTTWTAVDAGWTPPAPTPATQGLGRRLAALSTLRSQIEGLPIEVYEDDAWRPPMPGMPLFLMSPHAIERVLLSEADDFPFGALFSRMMRPAWGEGLLLSTGEAWKAQRRAASPPFRPAEAASFAPAFRDAAKAALGRWKADAGAPIELHREMRRLTFDVILDTMLSGEAGDDDGVLRERIAAFVRDISRIRPSYLLAPDAWHARRPPASSPHRAAIHEHIADVVTRRRMGASRDDLVDRLLAARDPLTGMAFDDRRLADNLLGFVLAGHETTAAALTWTLYLASAHAATAARIVSEIEAVTGGSPIEPEHIERLVFVRQVVSESLRLYPPAYLLTRVAARTLEIEGFTLRPGQRVNIPIYAIHRRARDWPQPHAFDPDRFAPDRPAPARFTYMPFGGGPRVCMGASFAMAEMVAVLATLMREVRFVIAPRARVWPQAGLGLFPRHGIAAQVITR